MKDHEIIELVFKCVAKKYRMQWQDINRTYTNPSGFKQLYSGHKTKRVVIATILSYYIHVDIIADALKASSLTVQKWISKGVDFIQEDSQAYRIYIDISNHLEELYYIKTAA